MREVDRTGNFKNVKGGFEYRHVGVDVGVDIIYSNVSRQDGKADDFTVHMVFFGSRLSFCIQL